LGEKKSFIGIEVKKGPRKKRLKMLRRGVTEGEGGGKKGSKGKKVQIEREDYDRPEERIATFNKAKC